MTRVEQHGGNSEVGKVGTANLSVGANPLFCSLLALGSGLSGMVCSTTAFYPSFDAAGRVLLLAPSLKIMSQER